MDPLAQLQNGSKEPTLESLDQTRKDNEDYNKPLDISLEEQKQQLKNSLYGNFNNEVGVKTSDEIEKLNNDSQNLSDSITDISTIENVSKLEDFNFTVIDGEFEYEVLNKVGKNYVKTPDENGNINVEKDFNIAIIETQNQILNECKNLKRDSKTYEVAIRKINSGNTDIALEGIESLYFLAYSNEGKIGYKNEKLIRFKKAKEDKLKKEAIVLEDSLEKAKQDNNITQITKLEQRKNEIILEASEITGIKGGEKIEDGDIFASAKEDKQSEGNDNDPLASI